MRFSARLHFIRWLKSLFVYEGYQTWIRGGEFSDWVLVSKDRFVRKFCADPFLFARSNDNALYLFYETLNKKGKGVLGCYKKLPDKPWEQLGIVLEERFHLSYPQVFEEDGHIYMIPESGDCGRGVVSLYEAMDFPRGWVKRQVLINRPYADSTLLRKDDRYYLACFTNASESAELWQADSLFGPWTIHPESCRLNQSRRLRRCAGGWLRRNGELYRVVQDCNGEYGKRVFGVCVEVITPSHYEEAEALCLLDKSMNPLGWKHTYNTFLHNQTLFEVLDVRRDVVASPLLILRRFLAKIKSMLCVLNMEGCSK